jgi:hypothetical protein
MGKTERGRRLLHRLLAAAAALIALRFDGTQNNPRQTKQDANAKEKKELRS